MPTLTCEISQSLLDALEELRGTTGDSTSTVVSHALADFLNVDQASLFQVSSPGALVAGVTRGSVTVGALTTHGDFGIGTFDDFDGEMVVLDGTAFQVTRDGVAVADPDDHVPYAVVVNFSPDTTHEVDEVESFDDLLAHLDGLRTTDNEFFAIRADATFAHVKTRAVCKSQGDDLVEAAQAQAEFEFDDVTGTILGFWSPAYTKAVSLAGWHLHFLDVDHVRGGHVLRVRGGDLRVQVQRIADFHVAFPETATFLHADLDTDRTEDLEAAEGDSE